MAAEEEEGVGVSSSRAFLANGRTHEGLPAETGFEREGGGREPGRRGPLRGA